MVYDNFHWGGGTYSFGELRDKNSCVCSPGMTGSVVLECERFLSGKLHLEDSRDSLAHRVGTVVFFSLMMDRQAAHLAA